MCSATVHFQANESKYLINAWRTRRPTETRFCQGHRPIPAPWGKARSLFLLIAFPAMIQLRHANIKFTDNPIVIQRLLLFLIVLVTLATVVVLVAATVFLESLTSGTVFIWKRKQMLSLKHCKYTIRTFKGSSLLYHNVCRRRIVCPGAQHCLRGLEPRHRSCYLSHKLGLKSART